MAAVDAFSFADQRIRVELVPPEGASESPVKTPWPRALARALPALFSRISRRFRDFCAEGRRERDFGVSRVAMSRGAVDLKDVTVSFRAAKLTP